MTAPDGSKRSWGRTLKNPIIHIEERFRLRIAMSTSETTLKGNLDFIDDDFWNSDIEDNLEKIDRQAASVHDNNSSVSRVRTNSQSNQDVPVAEKLPELQGKDSSLGATKIDVYELESFFHDDFEDDPGSEHKAEYDVINDKSCTSWDSSAVLRKRKFPGPAGMLPKCKAGSLSEIWKVVQEPQKRKSTTFQDLHCTPWTENPGSNWDLMKQDLNMEGGNSILELNIAWLLKMKRLNQLPQGKVPVTCVMVKKFCEGILHLQDPTGEIAASTDKCVLDLRDYFRTGTALVLQKVGVYSGSNGDYYLNITRDNIVNIYSHKDDCAHRVQVNPTSVEELVTSQMQCEALQDTRLLLGRHKSTPPRRKSHSATYNDSPPCGSVINASSGPLAKATKSHFQWLDDDIFLAIDDNFLS